MKYSRRVWRINNTKKLIMNSDSKHNSRTPPGHSSCPIAWIRMSYGCINPHIILWLLEMSPRENETVIQSKLERVPFISDNQSCVCVCVTQSLCFRIQKMMEVYRPDWCEKREDWSIYLFSPQNKYVLHSRLSICSDLSSQSDLIWFEWQFFTTVLKYCFEESVLYLSSVDTEQYCTLTIMYFY